MKIRIVTLAKAQEAELRPLEEDYRTRLSRFFSVEFIEIKREIIKDQKSFMKDWEKIKGNIGKSLLIMLDEGGKSFTSQGLSEQMNRWMSGGRDICFVIGGPEGFPDAVKKEADLLLSLSFLTFPHKIVRLLLIEALYRANDILQGGPYHRA